MSFNNNFKLKIKTPHSTYKHEILTIKNFTLQFLQQEPDAEHSASLTSLHVIGSQHGSFFWQLSNPPQSHSSFSSTILLPHFCCKLVTYTNTSNVLKYSDDFSTLKIIITNIFLYSRSLPHSVYWANTYFEFLGIRLCNRWDCSRWICTAEYFPCLQ